MTITRFTTVRAYSARAMHIACAATMTATAIVVAAAFMFAPTPEPLYELVTTTETDVYVIDYNLTLDDCRNAHPDAIAICVPQKIAY